MKAALIAERLERAAEGANGGLVWIAGFDLEEAAATIRELLSAQPVSRARTTDPFSSHKAIPAGLGRWSGHRARLLRAFEAAAYGLTDEEAGRATGLDEQGSCYWKRCNELRQLGYIAPTGRCGISRFGNQIQVSAITDLGREALDVQRREAKEDA